MFDISPKELDSISEFINIGMGKAAKILNNMLDSHIDLSITTIKILAEDEINKTINSKNQDELSIVEMGFTGEISGTASLLFPKPSALDLVQALTGDELETSDMDAIRVGTLSEIGNIVINSLMGMISNVLKMNLRYTVPKHCEGFISNILTSALDESTEEKVLIKIIKRFNIRNLSIEGNIIIFLNLTTFNQLRKLISIYIQELT